MESCTATIVTRNRAEEVCNAVASALEQTTCNEIVVVIDGTEDDTAERLRAKFPGLRIIENPERTGLCHARNQAINAASNDFILQFDDDAICTSPTTAEDIQKCFINDRVAGVCIPFINVNISDEVKSKHPNPPTPYVSHNFTGTAIMLRRSIFLKMGGFTSELMHWGEERDLVMRLVDNGYFLLYGESAPIHHLVSPRRDTTYQNLYLYRNQIFFNFLRGPLLYLPGLLVAGVAWSLVNAIRSGAIGIALRGLGAGFAACFQYASLRNPVSVKSFNLYMKLRKSGGLPLKDIETIMTLP